MTSPPEASPSASSWNAMDSPMASASPLNTVVWRGKFAWPHSPNCVRAYARHCFTFSSSTRACAAFGSLVDENQTTDVATRKRLGNQLTVFQLVLNLDRVLKCGPERR